MSCGIGNRHGSDLAWLWLAAIALIRTLAWEPLYALGVALKKKKITILPKAIYRFNAIPLKLLVTFFRVEQIKFISNHQDPELPK